MKCEEVRDELIAYARGELDEARKTAVEEHLVRCEGCTTELEGARKVMALTQMADAGSIHELADEILRAALARRASDIHIEAGRDGPRLRFRIDGVLHTQADPVITPEQADALIARFKQRADQNLSEKRLPQDGRFKFSHAGKEYDIRMNTFPYHHGESIVMRILDQSSVLVGLNKLGLSPRTLGQVDAMIARPNGLIIATGPTGAGKTTLLYSLLNKLNTPEKKIMTIEDPVEYLLPGVNQASMRRPVGLIFATALRAFMRQDPDIIMVGEIRDLETLEMATQASLTGHLVLTVLHTRDATSALTRLLDVGVAPFAVASALTGVIGQRLVRKVCPSCRQPYQPSQNLLDLLGFTPENQPATFVHGTGCEQCAQTGYKGRIGLFEVLTMNGTLSRMLADRAPESALRARGLELGALWPFVADARAKVAEGVTTVEEVDRVLPDVNNPGVG